MRSDELIEKARRCKVKARPIIPRELQWGEPDRLFSLISDRVSPNIVEIGSQWGWWARRALDAMPTATVHCIDPWGVDRGSIDAWGKGEENLLTWAHNVGVDRIGKRVFFHRTSSELAASWWAGKADLVFIDGDHHEDQVRRDIRAWRKKVKKGGYITGHDWDGKWGDGVQRAVRAEFGDKFTVMEDGYRTKSKRKVSPCWVHQIR